ncbi:hypothetical protein C0J52_17878 [Blattella germanica]|nr:hypothetical protein C0J52_17878 [Blattella germanica]
MSYEESRARILAILESVEEEEILGGENSESEDELEIDSYNSDGEQSAEEEENYISDDDLPLSQTT